MDIDKKLEEVKERQRRIESSIQELRELKAGSNSGVSQIVMAHPDAGERALHQVEKRFVAMVVLNACMGAMLILNWITDTNQNHVINAIYMMAPGLQEKVEGKKLAP